MNIFSSVCSRLGGCCKKVGACFTTVLNAKTIDAFYRGLSRGLGARTFVEILGILIGFDTKVASVVTAGLVFPTTVYTSYANSRRWWTTSTATVEALLSKPQTRCQRAQRLADAFFRGVNRAESANNVVILVGLLLDMDLKYYAAASAVLGLVLGSWGSYRRSGARREFLQQLHDEANRRGECSALLSDDDDENFRQALTA